MENKIHIRASILVFAEQAQQKLYRSFSLKGENVEIYSCREAFYLIKDCQAKIIIIDCGINIKLALKILEKTKYSHPHIPVILLTDKSSEEYAIQAFRLGVREYIRKPVNISELKKTIKHLLKVKRTVQEKRIPFVQNKRIDLEGALFLVKSDKPVNILAAIYHIEENLSEKISLADCAKRARLSKYHFCRYFKKHMGMSPMKYASSLRIMKAKQLLQRDDLSITEVSLSVGFNDYSAFSRCFKEIEGVTPKKYKDSLITK